MAQYGFQWPEKMDCRELPNFGDENNLCIDPRNGSTAVPTPLFAPVTPTAAVAIERESTVQPPPVVVVAIPKEQCSCSCPSPSLLLVVGADLDANYKFEFGGVSGCAAACRSPLASAPEMELGQYWITGWAVLCCLCTAFTLMTFVIDTKRFKYPEKPIVFIALCYLMVSVGFLIRVIVGHESVACNGPASIQNSVNSVLCTVVFLLLYFFGMASCIW